MITFQFSKSITTLVLLVAFLSGGVVSAQTANTAPLNENELAEIQDQLNELLKTMPKADESMPPANQDSEKSYAPEDMYEAEEQPNLDRIAELETLIDELKKKKNKTRVEDGQLNQYKKELAVAKTIALRLKQTRLTREKGGAKRPAATDIFVVARINIPVNANIADIYFSTLSGELSSVSELTDYLKATPEGNFRDFRVLSRHENESYASTALTTVRKEYDDAKQREKEMLEYIAARKRRAARIKAARRC